MQETSHPGARAAREPGRPAAIEHGPGRLLTYGELEHRWRRLAGLWRSRYGTWSGGVHGAAVGHP